MDVAPDQLSVAHEDVPREETEAADLHLPGLIDEEVRIRGLLSV